MPSLDLPHSLAYLIRTHYLRPVPHGRSSASVYRLERDGHPSLFLKTAPPAHARSLRDEAERLSWLHGRISVPEPLDFSEGANGAYLLTSAVPGESLTAFNESDDNVKRRTTELFAEGLRMLHEFDAADCPFVHSVREELSRAEASSIGDEVGDKQALLLELRSAQPQVEEQVLTHGDACLPNVLVMDGRLSGFVDLGCAGIGDLYRDLSLALWSLDYNYGAGWRELFLDTYGIADVDNKKLDYFLKLNSLF